MSYRDYVIGAYAVFAIVLAWDFIAPRLDLRRQLRAARTRAARAAARPDIQQLRRDSLPNESIE